MERLLTTLCISTIFVITALSANGQCATFPWAHEGTGTERDEGQGVAVDPFGNIFFGGWFDSDSLYFGDASGTNSSLGQNGNGDIFVARYKPDGTLSWVVSAGGFTNSDWCWDVAAGPDGSVFATGEFYSTTMDFGSGVFINKTGLSDAWVAKWDSTGAIQWARAFGAGDSDEAHGVAVDNAGNCYITGAFGQTIIHGSTTLVETGGGDDLFVAVYDPSGTPLWAVGVGGSSYDGGQDIAIDDIGNIYVAGRTFGDLVFAGDTLHHVGLGEIYLLSFSPSGGENWMFSATGDNADESRGVAVHPDGSIILVGSHWTTPLDFGGTTLTSNGQWDAFIASFDLNGNLQWVRSDGGAGTEHHHGVAVSPQGLIFTGGQWGSGAATIDGIPLSGYGAYTAVWDGQGNALKANSFTGTLAQFDILWGAAAGPDGTGYFGGEFTQGTVDFGGGVTVTHGPGGGFSSDVFLLAQGPNALDAPQNLTHTLAGPNLDLNWDAVAGAEKYRIKIKRVANGPKKKKLFVTSTNSLSITGFPFPPGDQYQWSVKAACATDTSDWAFPGSIAVPTLRSGAAMTTVFPNPATDLVNIRASIEGPFEFTVRNTLGQLVWTETGENFGSRQVDVSKWAPGVYTYSLEFDGQLAEPAHSGLIQVK